MKCDNCNNKIYFSLGSKRFRWFHRHSINAYCNTEQGTIANPEGGVLGIWDVMEMP